MIAMTVRRCDDCVRDRRVGARACARARDARCRRCGTMMTGIGARLMVCDDDDDGAIMRLDVDYDARDGVSATTRDERAMVNGAICVR